MYFFFLHVLGLPFHVIESELLEPPYGRKFQELFGVHEVHRNFVKKTISCRNKETILWFLQEISGFFSDSCKECYFDLHLMISKKGQKLATVD
jgi:hypothetical protein